MQVFTAFFILLGPSTDSTEEDLSLCGLGGSATVVEESRKEATPAPLPASGPELAAMMKIGTRVMRGVDWKWGDQVPNQLLEHLSELPKQHRKVLCLIFDTVTLCPGWTCTWLRSGHWRTW